MAKRPANEDSPADARRRLAEIKRLADEAKEMVHQSEALLEEIEKKATTVQVRKRSRKSRGAK